MHLIKLYTFTFLSKTKMILTGPCSSSGPKYSANSFDIHFSSFYLSPWHGMVMTTLVILKSETTANLVNRKKMRRWLVLTVATSAMGGVRMYHGNWSKVLKM